MSKGYWIARVDVADPEQYKAYLEANAKPFRMFGGRFLVRAGRFENPEGSSRSRNVVIYGTSSDIPSALKRLGSADEVAQLVAWLCSDASRFNTGAVFDMSGGRAR